ncbi:jg26928 [Pararge aegeria aegeria]|uniref:Jg26928 protein n=1 Tax=Pararge aegeria aegeria TaxID=348720 RepID=A0A8S4QL96_9NEOP|nr:jg26928 [Pararge aegeria aegeria]
MPSKRDRARLLALSAKESGYWLHALPSANLGTMLDHTTLSVVIGLRLGALYFSLIDATAVIALTPTVTMDSPVQEALVASLAIAPSTTSSNDLLLPLTYQLY